MESRGIDAGGSFVGVPWYRHDVSMDFTRVELDLDYMIWQRSRGEGGGRDSLNVQFRLPYDVKKQRSRIVLVDPATPTEIQDMQRFNDLHHRTETFTGLSDISLLLAYSKSGIFKEGDRLMAAIGTTIPVGETEENPFVAATLGIQHQHIQFGTGTVDPLAELYYTIPLGGKFSFTGYLLGRFPLYVNSKGYKGPTEGTLDLEVQFEATEWLEIHGGIVGLYQDFAEWNGIEDVNSGMFSFNALAGVSMRREGWPTLRLDLMAPVVQETLSELGDTFEQGLMALLTVSHSF